MDDNIQSRRPPTAHTSRPVGKFRQSVTRTVSGMRTLLGQIHEKRSTAHLREQKKERRKIITRLFMAALFIAALIWVLIKIF